MKSVLISEFRSYNMESYGSRKMSSIRLTEDRNHPKPESYRRARAVLGIIESSKANPNPESFSDFRCLPARDETKLQMISTPQIKVTAS